MGRLTVADKILNDLKVKEGDDRITYGTASNKQLTITVGQRYAFSYLPYEENPWHFINLKKIPDTDNIKVGQYTGSPEAYYYRCKTIQEAEKRISEIVVASQIELERSNNSSYRKHNNSLFEKAIFDIDYRNELFNSAFNENDSNLDMDTNYNGIRFSNTILYGPPGTGKTYKLLQLISELKLIKELSESKPDYNSFVAGYLWWEVLAMVLLDNEKASVPQMLNHELIKAKLAISNIQHVPQRLWSTLQNHTVEHCPNVKLKVRSGEPVFFKESDSNWRLENVKEFKEQFPFLVEEWTNFKVSGNEFSVQKNFLFTTCHQSLAYEDFIEGIKPVLSGTEKKSDETPGVQYEIRKGLFYQACEKASKLAGYSDLKEAIADSQSNRKLKFDSALKLNKIYVLFLDEINRTNVSSVFGELITLIENDKRMGAENEIVDTLLPYSQTKFAVPVNLFIVGTMNTADRSVEALDTALRRRFVFEEMIPEPALLSPSEMKYRFEKKYESISFSKDVYSDASEKFNILLGFKSDDNLLNDSNEPFTGINMEQLLTAINKRLVVLLSNDNAIGHAWLMNVYSLKDLQLAFKNKIYPLLQEYFYNNYAKIGLVLGDKFVAQKSEKKIFATFLDGENISGDYEGNTIYTLRDPSTLTIEDFKSIYL